MRDAVVQVRDLSKRYRKPKKSRSWWGRLASVDRSPPEYHVAVSGVSFDIKAGEIFGLLGPNGAGKTTTIKMLCTLLAPTGGTATINGYDVVKEAGLVRQSL